ncbi:MAG: excisionase family DNA-binding protein [Candidatus Omnitrophota bacterium]
MRNSQFIPISELAKLLGISRIAVFKKVKAGQIKAIRIGRNYAVERKYLDEILGRALSEKDKLQIEQAVKKTVAEYGEVLRLLGRE